MLPHTLITASAGSGKTWRLTVRYLRLVMMGAEPESIVALTFSRKAAGEFFNAILHRLAEAASGEGKAAALARDIEMPGMACGDFCQALVRLASRLPFLMLGTLDSFFIRMARSFPFELGLSGDFALLDGHQLAVEKLRVYDRVFTPDGGTAAQAAGAEFRRAFTEATFGKEEIRVRALLDDFVNAWHFEYLAAQDGDQWGNPLVIWGPDAPVVPGSREDRLNLIRRIETGLDRLSMEVKHRDCWTTFLKAVAEHFPGSPMSKDMDYLWEKLLALLEELPRGTAELKLNRKSYALSGPLGEAVADLCRDIIAGELAVALRQTRGIFEVVRKYDSAYHTLVRRQGRLTFHDVQLILSGGLGADTAGHAAREARLLTHADNRQLMDYRLDSRYDHWLLDEFQDTSRVQWRVLANLMDEAIQDAGGRKSFFAVGDQKQSIYEWRGGTPELFDELQAQYNLPDCPPERWPLKVEPMSLSQRSGPAVIDMVNTLLGDPAALAEVLPAQAVARWRWQPHTSKNRHYGGTALVIETDPKKAEDLARAVVAAETENADGDTEADICWRRAAELILDLQPLRRGLTCSVLCHRNDRALKLTDYLRRATGLQVVCESDLSMARDNPVTSALLALLQAAAHPGDEFAWRHVMMTPLAEVILQVCAPRGGRDEAGVRRMLPVMVLEQVMELGFHDTLRWWVGTLGLDPLTGEKRSLDAFSRGRLDELCGCAAAFDSTGSRDTDEFAAFARAWTERGASHDGAVQVMTVHRSKGLTFDVVIMPDLGYPYTFINQIPMVRETDHQGQVKWLTRLPGKDIAQADSVLGRALERSLGGLWCERIAGLYVMMTRAKFANYVILPSPKKSSKATGPSLHGAVRHMLQQDNAGTLSIAGVEYPLLARFGDPEWIQDHAFQVEPAVSAPSEIPQPAVPMAAPPPPPAAKAIREPPVQLDLFDPQPPEGTGAGQALLPKKTIPLRVRRPTYDGQDNGLPVLFQATRPDAGRTGSVTHQLLGLVEWADAGGREALGKSAARLFPQPDEAARQALADVAACLEAPALAGIFARPAGGEDWEVWRGRDYDVMLDSSWSSGVFDRVLVRRDTGGRAVEAVLLGFETRPFLAAADALETQRERMADQRAALAGLLGLKPAKVKCAVLHTRTAEMTEF
ncbi:MAG: UvrD/REP helicase [Verrucomicrobiales bacterium]|nr:UvrD/REP helicase [Verrucomicrobiales bacterium]